MKENNSDISINSDYDNTNIISNQQQSELYNPDYPSESYELYNPEHLNESDDSILDNPNESDDSILDNPNESDDSILDNPNESEDSQKLDNPNESIGSQKLDNPIESNGLYNPDYKTRDKQLSNLYNIDHKKTNFNNQQPYNNQQLSNQLVNQNNNVNQNHGSTMYFPVQYNPANNTTWYARNKLWLKWLGIFGIPFLVVLAVSLTLFLTLNNSSSSNFNITPVDINDYLDDQTLIDNLETMNDYYQNFDEEDFKSDFSNFIINSLNDQLDEEHQVTTADINFDWHKVDFSTSGKYQVKVESISDIVFGGNWYDINISKYEQEDLNTDIDYINTKNNFCDGKVYENKNKIEYEVLLKQNIQQDIFNSLPVIPDDDEISSWQDIDINIDVDYVNDGINLSQSKANHVTITSEDSLFLNQGYLDLDSSFGK